MLLKGIKNTIGTTVTMWISFMVILKLFGVQYAILGFYMGIFHLIRSRSKFEVKKYLKDVIFQLILAVVAIIASQNAVLTFIMNFAVIFLIAYIFFTYATPMGYMLYFIEFVFLQLRPLKLEEIPMMLLLLITYFVIMFVIFFIKSRIKRTASEAESLIDQGISGMIEYHEALIENKVNGELTEKLEKLVTDLYNSLHNSMTFPSKMKKKNLSEYYMIVIIKRMLMFHKVLTEREISSHKSYIENRIEDIKFIQENMKHDERKCIDRIDEMIDDIDKEDEFLKRNFGGILLFLRRILAEDFMITEFVKSNIKWQYILVKDFIKNHGAKLYYEVNSFRIAFALRLAVVTAGTLTASHFIPVQYGYWLPINAVFLVRPFYEDSQLYMKQRLAGTFIGSIFLAVVLSLFGSTQVCLAIFFVTSLIFYATPADKWIRNFWSTLFGTSLVAMSIGVGTAVELKLFYIVLASIVALVANRFFLPKDKKGVYINNYRNIGLLSSYQLDNAFKEKPTSEERKETGLKIIFDFMQTHYIMLSMKNYVGEIKDEERKKNVLRVYRKLSDVVFSIEKLFFLYVCIVPEKRRAPDITDIKALLDRFIYEVQNNIAETENTLNMIIEETDDLSEQLKSQMISKVQEA